MELQVRKNVSLKLLDPRSLLIRIPKVTSPFCDKNESKIQSVWAIRFIKPGTGEVLIALLDDFVRGFNLSEYDYRHK